MAKRSCSIVQMHSFLDYLVELRKQRNLALEYDSFWWDVDEAHVHETMIPGNVLLAFECAIGLSYFFFFLQ